MKHVAIVAVALSLFVTQLAHGSVCAPNRDSNGHIKRSSYQVSLFKKSNPCPSTGKRSGKCPGYIVDHIKPLACCGIDKPSNMQWQTYADSKIKDKVEIKQCGGTE